MKRMLSLILVLSLLLVVGCNDKEDKETTVATVVNTLGMDDIELLFPTSEPESTAPTEKRKLLEIVQQGRLSGAFLEDGSDETVENVACALIRNTAEQYLDYGEVTATVGETVYRFVVTGLPGGASVWVMEKDRKTLADGTSFAFQSEQVSQLRDALPTDDRVEIRLLDGKLSVSNVSDVPLSSVRIYYKQVHGDGNFLGGITYTCVAENLGAGESVELTAGHSRAQNCAVVRVDVTQ